MIICTGQSSVQKFCVQAYCVKEYYVQEYCVQEYCLQEYCEQEYSVQEYCVQEYSLVVYSVSSGPVQWVLTALGRSTITGCSPPLSPQHCFRQVIRKKKAASFWTLFKRDPPPCFGQR